MTVINCAISYTNVDNRNTLLKLLSTHIIITSCKWTKTAGCQIKFLLTRVLDVRQGCCLPPTLFNSYLDDMLTAWKIYIPPGRKIDEDTYVNTILYDNDQVVLRESENALQISIRKLSQTAMEYNLNISTKKTKTVAFHAK